MREGFRLGELIVDPTAGAVLRPDGLQRLAPRVAATLSALAERPGQTVARRELIERAWPGGTGSDDALVKCVGELRRALGDDPRRHRYVETVAGHGYRLVVDPQPLTENDRERLATATHTAASRSEPSWWTRMTTALLSGSPEQRVIKLGALYLGAAPTLIQSADVILPKLGLPDSAVRFVILLGLLGLPVVLALAWFYKPASPVIAPSWRRTVLRPLAVGLLGLGLLGSIAYGLSQWLGGRAAPAVEDRSIAVLPFDNLSGDPANEFLGDGLAEELANQLTRVPDLQVASRTSAFALKGRQLNIGQIAAELGVRYVIEGSIRRNADTLLVTSQLIDGPSGFHVWSKTYRRRIEELQNVEDEISGSVIEALRIVLAPETLERMAGKSVQRDAYEANLQGISELRQLTDESALERAAKRFEDAVAIDPTYAEAYAGLCETSVQRYMRSKAAASIADAERTCAQAAKLDSGLPGVHVALGTLYVATGQPAVAEREYEQAIALDPDLVEARIGIAAALNQQGRVDAADEAYQAAVRQRPRYWAVYGAYGGFLLGRNRLPEAIAQYQRGVELAPGNAALLSNLGGSQFLHGDFAEAADAFRRSVELTPTGEGYSNTGTTYFYAGRYGDAVAMFEQATRLAPSDYQFWGNLGDGYRRVPGKAELAVGAYERAAELARAALSVNPDSAVTRALLAYFLVRQGRREQAATELETARATPGGDVYSHYYAALVYKELGDVAAAVVEAGKALELGYPATLLRADPELASLSSNPALSQLLDAHASR
jgi:TolB-like protein/Tfp pilus assembly protein PilF/DNA-binding winged helix-turn-helix (wHTH) protein